MHDGAVLPILHLNGYKIAGPTVLARIPRDELEALFHGYGYKPYFVEGDDPTEMHQLMARRSTRWSPRSERIQADAARQRIQEAPALADDHPALTERLDRSRDVDGKPIEGTFRSHQVPMGDMSHPGHVKILEEWMKSYRPEELFDETGKLRCRTRRAGAEGRAPHERQSARQRRPAAAGASSAGFPRLRA